MATSITIVRNDYGKPINFTVAYDDGTLYDLTGLIVTFKVDDGDGALLVEEVCSFVGCNTEAGECKYVVQDGDFDETGEFSAELEITDSATVPSYVWTVTGLTVTVVDDLPK